MQKAQDDVSSSIDTFSIKSESNEFQMRQASVFDQLSALETQHVHSRSEWAEEEDFDDESSANDGEQKAIANESKPLSAESQFKIPVGLPIKRNKADHQVNPEKWTKYSLADVDDEDLSEASNAQAASDFLKDKWATSDCDYEKKVDGDISYGHFRMPEYVVGKPKTSTKRKTEESSTTDSQKIPATATRGTLSFDEKQLDSTNEGDISGENSSVSSSGDTLFRTVKKRLRHIRKMDENDITTTN
ncbi:hypothetical protein CHUAL_006376 [Chamberlinius hualienensis]